MGDPKGTRTAGEHVAEAARVMAGMGWQVRPVKESSDHFNTGATRDGFDVAIKMWKGKRTLQFTGETPVFHLRRAPTDG